MNVNENIFFREMTLRICGTLDIDEALTQAFVHLRDHIPAETMGLGYFDDRDSVNGGARIFIVANIKQPGARYVWSGESNEIVLSKEAGEYLSMLPDGFPNVFAINRDEQRHHPMNDVFPGMASSSAAFLRLLVEGELTGVLLVSAKGQDRYTQGHLRLLGCIREPFAIAMANARRYLELVQVKDRLAEDNRALAADIKRTAGVEVIGADFGLRRVMEQVRQVAPSNSPTLILGETGTGKEVIASAIHMASPRSKGPMITMQCSAIPDTLLDSELFGHEKGAFTGALEQKRGRFERADGGTLFLDEIGELSHEAQVKLLRVLQERRFERVGGIQPIEVNVRIIAATHRDLYQMVRDGDFREDLWYRLNVLPIVIPPLRLRREDIPSLVQYFVERKIKEMNLRQMPRISSHDLERLKAYDWPGNVRELQNIVERALIVSRGDSLRFPPLTVGHLSTENPTPDSMRGRVLTMDEAIANHIRTVLNETDWRVAGPGGAAEILRMKPSTLRFRMKKLGIKRKRKGR